MRLLVVGCTGSLAGPASPASSYVVQIRDQSGRLWTVAMDLGSGALGSLQAILPPEALDFVALSHLHPDHCADLTGLAVYAKYRPGAAMGSLRVHGPADTPRQLAALQYAHDPTSQGGDFEYGAWEEGQAVGIGPLTLTPYRMLHPVEAWGFRVEGPSDVRPGESVTLGYTGDTDTTPGLAKVADGVDLLLAEAAFEEGRDAARGIHLTGRRAGLAAQAGGAKRVVVTHLPPWNDPAVTLRAVRAVYSGPVHLARRGASFLL
ncbi:MAG: MBL fold metallo-hydrolase [Bifidobacteriaceae bacterium]|jgi:ribonuclease BN (tRNA processing enzyme)|nr:MBL fold metallo-hydrolase [Bifidobacteriaceae bacterium]